LIIDQILRVDLRSQQSSVIPLARQWQEDLEAKKHASPAALGRYLNVTRARVTQILNLLNLAPEVQEQVAALGHPLASRSVTERSLRPLLGLPTEEQKKRIHKLISRYNHSLY